MLALSDRDCYRREELLDQIHESPPLKDNGLWKQGDLASAQRGNTLTLHFSLGKDAPAISPDFQSPLLAPFFKRCSLEGLDERGEKSATDVTYSRRWNAAERLLLGRGQGQQTVFPLTSSAAVITSLILPPLPRSRGGIQS